MESTIRIKDDLRGIYFTAFSMGLVLFVLYILVPQILGLHISCLFLLSILLGILIVFLPIEYSIFSFYLYLFFDGAIKINTNYHPIFHVAQDIIILVLLLRSIIDKKNGGLTKFLKVPFASLIYIFLLWILVQYINPFGLGILPSIAGTKVYFSGIIIFLISYQHLQKEHFEKILVWLTCLGLAQGFIASIEYLYFQGFVFQLHPKYAAIAGDSFVGDLYRPFGTTSAPGAPSMWIFLTASIAMHLLINSKKKWMKLVSVLHLVFSIPTLVFCQTRAAILLTILNIITVLLCPHGGLRNRFISLFGLALLGYVLFATFSINTFTEASQNIESTGSISNVQLKVIEDRTMTLVDSSSLSKARSGALGEMFRLADLTIYGIGLSRVGAASAVWKERIQRDEYFGKKWSFADNLYRAVFTELGIFGLFFWLVLVLAISISHLRKSFHTKYNESRTLLWLCGSYPLVMLIGGMGSEGILYNPTSGFFWLMLAIGLKEVKNVA